MAQAERVGIYGGTFDPIHIGHLAIAEEARALLALDRVFFVPAAYQPLKGQTLGAPAHHRFAMVSLACADNPAFVPDDLELRRPPPSYTADTLEQFRARLGPGPELWFILGADAARDLRRWRRIDTILALAHLAIVGRPGTNLALPALVAALPALAERATLLDGPHLPISSTELRRRLAAGLPIRYQVPEAVRAYIVEHNLYV